MKVFSLTPESTDDQAAQYELAASIAVLYILGTLLPDYGKLDVGTTAFGRGLRGAVLRGKTADGHEFIVDITCLEPRQFAVTIPHLDIYVDLHGNRHGDRLVANNYIQAARAVAEKVIRSHGSVRTLGAG